MNFCGECWRFLNDEGLKKLLQHYETEHPTWVKEILRNHFEALIIPKKVSA